MFLKEKLMIHVLAETLHISKYMIVSLGVFIVIVCWTYALVMKKIANFAEQVCIVIQR